MPDLDRDLVWGPATEPSLLALRGIRLIEGAHGAGSDTDTDTDDDLDEDDAADADTDDEQDPDGADQLQDAGKRALEAMKAKWKAEREKRKALEQQLTSKTDAEPVDDAEKIRADAETAANQRANARILKSEIRAASAGRLSDPADALRFIDIDQFDVDDDGAFDQDEIREAIDALLESRPYLAAQGQRRHGDGGNGPRGRSNRLPQLTSADIEGMPAEAVLAARKAGQLKDLLSGKKS